MTSPIAPESGASRTVLHTVAKLHYEADLSQVEIARRLGVSAATVSRLLRRARDEGIVRIEIRDVATPEDVNAALVARLGLKRAAVIDAPEAGGLAALAAPVGALLKEAGLKAGSVLAIGWGRTLREVLLAGLPRLPGIVTVAAMGGMQQPAPEFQINELVRLAAEQLGGTPRFIHAPYLPSAEARAAYLGDPATRDHIALWSRLDAVLVGIGLPVATDRALGGTAGTPSDPALAAAAGDVLQHFYDEAGTLMPWDGEARLIAVTPTALRAVPLAIGVAVSVAKVPAIVGAARAGLVNALVTDLRTAQAVIDHIDAEAKTG
ncbi:sugar-binding transcriptional regulator [Segnochrobactrum spirostomi]|uniref:sugar-binding transcriptional regulator n=1 Tax=Segnochrobactrum spirostomi TaxID=2608987 RepID=UPI0028B16719|nr:sugar-binding domain-containing protein [Segnochrobactrum spirostomi]